MDQLEVTFNFDGVSGSNDYMTSSILHHTEHQENRRGLFLGKVYFIRSKREEITNRLILLLQTIFLASLTAPSSLPPTYLQLQIFYGKQNLTMHTLDFILIC